jgi:hypothetical protein
MTGGVVHPCDGDVASNHLRLLGVAGDPEGHVLAVVQPGTDFMFTVICDFRQFSAENGFIQKFNPKTKHENLLNSNGQMSWLHFRPKRRFRKTLVKNKYAICIETPTFLPLLWQKYS